MRQGAALLRKVMVAALLLLIVALVSALTVMHFAIQSAEIAVPDLNGMTLQDATHRAAALDLTLILDGRVYSPGISAGRVVSQSPGKGSLVGREASILVTESLGAPSGGVPDMIGQHEQMAILELRRLGFEIDSTARVPDDTKEPGTVLSQSPSGQGTLASLERVEQPGISLLVSERSAPRAAAGFIMPDFTGQPVTAAREAILTAGFKLGRIREATPERGEENGTATVTNVHGQAAAGTVVSQLPAAGYRVDSSTVIELTVAR